MTPNATQEINDIDGDAKVKQDAKPGVDGRFADGTPEIDVLKAALADMEDRWMRSEAEIANVRLRAKRDVEDARQFAVQKFASDVVETAENLRRGLSNLPPAAQDEPKSIAGLRAGLSEIERGFIATLEKNGIKAVDPTGSAFVPGLHQAIGEREAAGRLPGTVLQSVGAVWTLNGRLVRPAMVVVAKEPSGSSAATLDP
jgi:molecular chaperone GrpE